MVRICIPIKQNPLSWSGVFSETFVHSTLWHIFLDSPSWGDGLGPILCPFICVGPSTKSKNDLKAIAVNFDLLQLFAGIWKAEWKISAFCTIQYHIIFTSRREGLELTCKTYVKTWRNVNKREQTLTIVGEDPGPLWPTTPAPETPTWPWPPSGAPETFLYGLL